ncbi:MAG: LysM peptidoglycan-binding domain-containing protein [Clostridiales bacterium]|nr:LysM peptidoglycan-binding domain-containing protein [Clostridiales bacterium]
MKQTKKRTAKKYIIRRRAAAAVMALIAMTVLVYAMSAVSANALKNRETAVVTVCTGDTLWDIANKINTSSKDIRKVVDDIMRLNRLDGADLHAGDRLVVPVY